MFANCIGGSDQLFWDHPRYETSAGVGGGDNVSKYGGISSSSSEGSSSSISPRPWINPNLEPDNSYFNKNNFGFLSSESFFEDKMSCTTQEMTKLRAIPVMNDEEEEERRSVSPVISTPPPSQDDALLQFCKDTSYPIIQRNGQRIYGGPPPGWIGSPPAKGSEVFVGKLPRDCFEDELVPLFSRCGKIYEMRLMMDFSGSNRGYLFVLYTNKDEARRAIKDLNNFEIRPGKQLGVVKSVDNRKLWISGIPKNRTAEEIRQEMEKQTEGVRDVVLYSSQTDKSKTRGYAFIEYETHRAAALARRKLVPGRVFILGHEIEKVDWAEPENDVDDEIMSKVRILFVRNISPSTTEAQINDFFENLCGDKLERVKKTKDYAFVHFYSRESAEIAFARSDNVVLDGSPLDIDWSKPVDKNIYNARKELTKALTTTSPPVYPYEQLPINNCTISCRGGPGTLPPRSLMHRISNVRAINGTGGHKFFPPTTPKTTSMEALHVLCDRNNWGKPIYNTMGSKTRPNDEMLYTCKVTIPQYPIPHPANVFHSIALQPTEEETKNDVAALVLNNLEVDYRKQAAAMTAAATFNYPYDPQMVMAAFAAAATHHTFPPLYVSNNGTSPMSTGGTSSTYAIPYNFNQYSYGRYGGPPPPYGFVNDQLANSLYNVSLNSQQ